MAKLSARGRREWIRAYKVVQVGDGQVAKLFRAYMSDGNVLTRQTWLGTHPHKTGWKKGFTFDLVKPLPEIRRELTALGWELVTS